jgi:hypothetical protein
VKLKINPLGFGWRSTAKAKAAAATMTMRSRIRKGLSGRDLFIDRLDMARALGTDGTNG